MSSVSSINDCRNFLAAESRRVHFHPPNIYWRLSQDELEVTQSLVTAESEQDWAPSSSSSSDNMQEFISNTARRSGITASKREHLAQAWLNDFRGRPSWCDAGMCLTQIKREKARGNTWALRARSIMQSFMFSLGRVIQSCWPGVLFLTIVGLLCVCIPLKDVEIVTDIVKLWVEEGGNLENELRYSARVSNLRTAQITGHISQQTLTTEIEKLKFHGSTSKKKEHYTVTSIDPSGSRDETQSRTRRSTENNKPVPVKVIKNEAPPLDDKGDGGLSEGFTLFIQTPKRHGLNVLTQEDLLAHTDMVYNISRLAIVDDGYNFTVHDFCFKPPRPPSEGGLLSGIMDPIVEKIIPCIFISPLDCFWEGSKSLGPMEPIYIDPFYSTFVGGLSDYTGQNLTWENLNPTAIMDAIEKDISLGSLGQLLRRSGLGDGYQSRPCIDPFDIDCPETSPNKVPICKYIELYLDYVNNTAGAIQLDKEDVPADPVKEENAEEAASDFFGGLFSGRRKRQANEPSTTTPKELDYYDLYGNPNDKKVSSPASYYSNDVYDDSIVDMLDRVDGDVKKSMSKRASSSKEEVPIPKDKRPYICRAYSKSMIKLAKENPNELSKFVHPELLPKMVDYGKELSGGCEGFARAILGWPEQLILGGLKRDPGQELLTKVEAYQTVMLLSGAGDLFSRYNARTFDPPGKAGWMNYTKSGNWTFDKAQDIISRWQRAFTDLVYNSINNTDKIDERQFHPLAGTSITDMMKQFSEFNWGILVAGYVFMFLYAGLTMLVLIIKKPFPRPAVNSYVWLGFVGVLLVTLASCAGLGFATLIGIHFNAATTQIVPFLTLGLGVDDMFLLVHNYAEIIDVCKGKDELAYLLKETGLSVMLTSISNILAFSVGSLLPIPAMRSFCMQTAIVLFFNCIVIITAYPAIMALDLYRRKHNLMDLFCCFKSEVKSHHEVEIVDRPLSISSKRNSVSSTRHTDENGTPQNTYHKLTDELKGSINEGATPLDEEAPPMRQNGTYPPPVVAKQPKMRAKEEKDSCVSHLTLHHFVHKLYIPLLQMKPVKALVLLLSLGLFCMGIIGVWQLEDGLELSDVMAKNTPAYDFLEAREKYFSFYPMSAVLYVGNDIPNKQLEITQMRRDMIDQSPYTLRGAKLTSVWFLSLMNDFLFDAQDQFDDALAHNLTSPTTMDKTPCANMGRKNDTSCNDETIHLVYHMLCSAGDQVNCSRVLDTKLITGSRDAAGNATINPEAFYNYVTAWYNIEQMSYGISQANFQPTPPSYKLQFNASNPVPTKPIPAAEPLVFAQIPFFLTNLTHTTPIVDLIQIIRGICDRYEKEYQVFVYPAGIPFTFWEQYLHLRWNLMQALLVITACVFVVISLLLVNPWTGLIVVGVLAVMVVELAGFMGLVGLKLNPISAVSMVTAVGIGVEFIVHVSFCYLTSLGTPNERMGKTLSHMFIPVVHGGVSTLLGIIMLLFSEFEFIISYFFMVLFALVVLGLINGLAFLPVLLSLIGPTCEVQPLGDDPNHLEPPVEYLTHTHNGHQMHKPRNAHNYYKNEIGHRQQPSDMSTISEEGARDNNNFASVQV